MAELISAIGVPTASAAAISELHSHAVVLMYHLGNVLAAQHYTHEQPQPEE